MAEDTSIVISAKDNFSAAITTMRNSNQAFNKDLSGLQQKLDALNKTKVTLKIDSDKARSALKDAEKQFVKTGDAADKLKLEMASQNYDNANRNLRLVSSNAKQAEKDILSLTTTSSKADNRAGSTGGGKFLNTLAASGASAYLGQVASQLANSYVSSAYGDEAGTLFGSALSGAGMGAAIGTAIAPGIGTAIGAALGGVVGAIQGVAQNAEKKDESFKEYYRGLYDTVTEAQKSSLQSGADIAAVRETDSIAFSSILGGRDTADAFLGTIRDFGAQTPFEYDNLTALSKTMLGFGYKQEEIIGQLTKIGDAGAALGWSTDKINNIQTYLGRMKTTGKATMEFLNPIMEGGVDVFTILAEKLGIAREEVSTMVSKGLIPGEDAAKAISEYLGDTYAGSLKTMSETYSGLVSTLADAQNELNNAMGEGYTQARKGGLQEQADYLSGDDGKNIKDAYYKLGQYEALLENKKEELARDAEKSITSGVISDSFMDSDQLDSLKEAAQQYQVAMADFYEASKFDDETAMLEAGAAMKTALLRGQAIAANEYNSGEGAQIEKNSMLALAENLRSDTALNGAYYDTGYTMAQAFSKGFQTGIGGIGGALASVYTDEELTIQAGGNTAYGLSYVPYDDFPARLHEGERVLTAAENRSYKAGGAPVTISGNYFTVREEADIDKITTALASKLAQAMLLYAE